MKHLKKYNEEIGNPNYPNAYKNKKFVIMESANDPYAIISALENFINENTDYNVYDHPNVSSDVHMLITKDTLNTDDEIMDVFDKIYDDEIEYTQISTEDESGEEE